MLDKLIDIFAKWPTFGQCFFLVFLVLVFCGMLIIGIRYTVIAIRGWPTIRLLTDNWDDDTDIHEEQ